MRNKDRIRGCLIGGAAGDALGYEVEFLRETLAFAADSIPECNLPADGRTVPLSSSK